MRALICEFGNLVRSQFRIYQLISNNLACLRIESFLSLGSIMAFRSDRFPTDRTFFEELFLDEELADLALQMGSAAFLFLS